jgi:hypothetical protein
MPNSGPPGRSRPWFPQDRADKKLSQEDNIAESLHAGRDDDGSALELAVVMIAVFTLLALGLLLGVRWLAAEAAAAAAQRGLEVAQSPGGTAGEARRVAVTLAESSRVVDAIDVAVDGTADTVTVHVVTHTVLGETVTRAVSGPRLRFVPQRQASP